MRNVQGLCTNKENKGEPMEAAEEGRARARQGSGDLTVGGSVRWAGGD